MLNEEQIARLQAFIARYNAGVRSADKQVTAEGHTFARIVKRETGFVFARKKFSEQTLSRVRESARRAREVRNTELAEFRAWKAAQAQKQAAE